MKRARRQAMRGDYAWRVLRGRAIERVTIVSVSEAQRLVRLDHLRACMVWCDKKATPAEVEQASYALTLKQGDRQGRLL